jgi:hypothetical protein
MGGALQNDFLQRALFLPFAAKKPQTVGMIWIATKFPILGELFWGMRERIQYIISIL